MRKTAAYIGLDVGSSGCKAAVLDRDGNILIEKRREYGFEYPSKGRVELNSSDGVELCKRGSDRYCTGKM